MTAPHRRGLVGLEPRGRPPVTPIERMIVVREDGVHVAVKQMQAQCVNGIDHWWLETACGEKAVVTEMSSKEGNVSCLICLMA